MKKGILFKRLSIPSFPEGILPLRKAFSIYSDGGFYHEKYELTEEGSSDFLAVKILVNKRIPKSEKKLIFKSSLLALRIIEKLDILKNEIDSLPETPENPLLIFDGYFDYIQFQNKKVKGFNLLTELPFTRSKNFETLNEDDKEKEIIFENLSKFYLEFDNVLNEFRENIHEFAYKNLNPFKDNETMLGFGKKCEALGFKMDSGQKFYRKYPEAYKKTDELKKVIDTIFDIDLIGSAIYSKWRYYSNWALPSEQIPTEWFLEMMSHLGQLTIENYETPSMRKKQLIKETGIPKDFYILEYFETNNLVYFSACKEKTPTRFYTMGSGIIDNYFGCFAKWKNKENWFNPSIQENIDFYIETKKCKNLAILVEERL